MNDTVGSSTFSLGDVASVAGDVAIGIAGLSPVISPFADLAMIAKDVTPSYSSSSSSSWWEIALIVAVAIVAVIVFASIGSRIAKDLLKGLGL